MPSLLPLWMLVCLISGDKWEIRSCSGCKLNRLPELRRFLKDEAKQFEGLNVKYIHGRNPDLVLLSDDGNIEKEIYDLSHLATIADIKQFISSKGIRDLSSHEGEL